MTIESINAIAAQVRSYQWEKYLHSLSLPLRLAPPNVIHYFLGCIGKNECFFNGSRIHSASNLIAKARRNTKRSLE